MKTTPEDGIVENSVTRLTLSFSHAFVNNNSSAEYLFASVYQNLLNQLKDLYERYEWDEFDETV